MLRSLFVRTRVPATEERIVGVVVVGLCVPWPLGGGSDGC